MSNPAIEPSGLVRIMLAPATVAARPPVTRSDMEGFADRSFPMKPTRLSPVAPSKTVAPMASAAFARCVESRGFSNMLRRSY